MDMNFIFLNKGIQIQIYYILFIFDLIFILFKNNYKYKYCLIKYKKFK